jgi:hypothetical protein
VKRRPRLLVVLQVEDNGRVFFDVDTAEDEALVRAWLHETGAFRRLPSLVEQALDDLDRRDGESAA